MEYPEDLYPKFYFLFWHKKTQFESPDVKYVFILFLYSFLSLQDETVCIFCVFSGHRTYPGKYVFHLRVTWPGQRCVHKYLAPPYIAGQGGACYKNTQVEARAAEALLLLLKASRHAFLLFSLIFQHFLSLKLCPLNTTYKRHPVSANYFGLWWS